MHQTARGIILICIAGLLCFVVTGLYNHPTGDDFWYAWMVKQYGFLGAQHQWFITITGRFTSNAVMSASPLCFDLFWGYKLFPPLVIAAFIWLSYKNIRLFFSDRLSKLVTTALAFVTVLFYYANMPNLYEGLYWLSGVAVYQLSLLVLLAITARVQSYFNQPSRKNLVLTGLLCFIMCGMNEVVTVVTLFITGCLFVYDIWKNRRMHPLLATIIAGSAAAFTIELFSIGNQIKRSITGHHLDWTITDCLKTSILQTGYHIVTHVLLTPVFWLVILLFGFFFAQNRSFLAEKCQKLLHLPILLLPAILSGAVFIPAAMVVYLEKNIAPMRILNISVFLFLVLSLVTVLLWVLKKDPAIFSKAGTPALLKMYSAAAFSLLAVLPNNAKTAMAAILSGDAATYNREAFARYERIRNNPADSLEVPAYTKQPAILCPSDIGREVKVGEHWGKVFGKKLVLVEDNR